MATTITGTTIDVGPNKLVANSAGNVGIGTASPTLPLDIVSNASADALKLRARSGNDYATMTFSSNDGATKWADIQSNVAKDLRFYTNGSSETMRIDAAGIVTKPLQPAFLVGSSGITNLAVNAYVTVPWNVSEIFDIGSNFASNRFTAPVTGKYQLAVSLRVENLDSASQYYILQFTTSNRTYRIIFDPDFGQDNAFWDFGLSTLADMDAGDTATVEIHQASGTAQTDINASANWSFFSGYLVC